jgi:hypothetical protein
MSVTDDNAVTKRGLTPQPGPPELFKYRRD